MREHRGVPRCNVQKTLAKAESLVRPYSAIPTIASPPVTGDLESRDGVAARGATLRSMPAHLPAPDSDPAPTPGADARKRGPGTTRMRLRAEIWIVLALAILPSSASAIISLARLAASTTPIADATTRVNPPVADQAVWDALFRLVSIAADLAPVALVIWLLWTASQSGFQRLGLDLRQPWRDLGFGVALAAVIGVPGIAVYLGSRLAGMTPQVVAGEATTGLGVAILVLAALRAALVEEVIVVGYLGVRLRQLGWSPWAFIVASALLRGSYHLYQGPAMAAGNVAMGLVFASWYWRWSRPRADGRARPGSRRRVAALVVAHTLLDVASFVGYPLAASALPGLF